MGIAFDPAGRGSISEPAGLPRLTIFRTGLKVQPVNAARVAVALITHCVAPDSEQLTRLNTPASSCSALEIVQFWNCIQECQPVPVARTATPVRPVIWHRLN